MIERAVPGVLILLVSLVWLPPAQAEPMSPGVQRVSQVTYDERPGIEDREVITVFLVLAGLLTLIVWYGEVKTIHLSRVLVAAYVVLAVGCVLTVLESLFLGQLLNLVEHLCYLTSTCLVAFYCWSVGVGGEESRT